MASDEVFRLSQLAQYLQQVLAINFESSFWIEAEINQINESRGNYYIDLVEKDADSDELLASVGGRIWRSQVAMIRRKLQGEITDYLRPGMNVKVRGNVKFHAVYGMAFHIDDIDKDFTLGEIERKKLETIQRLTRDGVFAMNKAHALPMAVQRIAVISSRTAAGYADFINQLQENQHNIPFQVDLYHSAVQGQRAIPEIAASLQLIENHATDYDVVCILRGGGSKLDLSAFDDESLNRQAAAMSIPVLTGIGHEVDTAILDMTAHTALKTPTALAAFLIDRNLELLNQLYHYYQRGIKSAKYKVTAHKQKLDQLAMRAERQALLRAQQCSREIEHAAQTAEFTARHQLSTIKQTMGILREKAHASDPSHILNRGFVLASNAEGIVRSAKVVGSNEALTLLFHDGKVKTTTDEL